MARSWTPTCTSAAWWEDEVDGDGIMGRQRRMSHLDDPMRRAGSKVRRPQQQKQRSGFNTSRRPAR